MSDPHAPDLPSDPAPGCGSATLRTLQGRLREALERHRALVQQVADLQSELATALSRAVALRDREQRARHAAEHDALTLLPNRTAFCQGLEDALGKLLRQLQAPPLTAGAAAPVATAGASATATGAGHATPAAQAAAAAGPSSAMPRIGLGAPAVLFIDLDRFKPINDRHGPRVGDAVLCIVAARLTHALRAGDLVARLGGDEFACLLSPGLDRSGLQGLALKLGQVLSEPLQVGALALQVRASIGIALVPADGRTVEELLHSADSAMYRAKRQGLSHAFCG